MSSCVASINSLKQKENRDIATMAATILNAHEVKQISTDYSLSLSSNGNATGHCLNVFLHVFLCVFLNVFLNIFLHVFLHVRYMMQI